ncbi:MAG TPA: DoxX family protein [Acidimicrobiales bacterium]|nr:DoxX family protein [Acidimicrobiales bacterium]
MGSGKDLAPLTIRVVFGGCFMYAGARKLFLKQGHANIVHILQGMGFPAPQEMSWLVGLVEFGGGLSLVTGTLTRPLAVVNVFNLIGNITWAVKRGGFPDPLPGQQPLPGYLSSILGIGGLSSLVLGGPGRYSVDGLLSRRNGGQAIDSLVANTSA